MIIRRRWHDLRPFHLSIVQISQLFYPFCFSNNGDKAVMSEPDRPAGDENCRTAKEDFGRSRPCRRIVVEYFEVMLCILVKVHTGNRNADSILRDCRREAEEFVGSRRKGRKHRTI